MSDSASSPPTTDPPRLGRYTLLEKLGEGGMGEVYLAHDTQLERKVALKVLPPHAVNDPDAVGRFQREARALAKLSHPGIVQAYDSGAEEGKQFLVMEYIEGSSLAAVLKDRGRVSPTRAADFACQAARALQHAHEKGLVHRDVKPSNLLVTAKGQLKLLDLGLARFMQDQLADPARTREGMGMGTPDYASPEQFRDAHAADARSDIYSLGCTLYHLIAGRVPFPTTSSSEKFQGHATQEPTPLEELCPEVPAGLALVVQQMMAKRPADRYQTAAELADALSPYVAGSSVSFDFLKATGTWNSARTAKELGTGARRLPWLVAGFSLAAVILMVLGFVTPGWFRPEATPENPRVASKPEEPDGTKADDRKDQAIAKKDDGGKEKSSKDDPKPEVLKPLANDDADVLTVSEKPEGRGHHRTIGAALKEVKRGQTIRVLDNAVYREVLSINSPSRYDGVTLEAVAQATIETNAPINMINLSGVRRFSLRGFQLRAKDVVATTRGALLVGIQRFCPGLVLEDLVFIAEQREKFIGIEILPGVMPQSPEAEAMIVRHCTFHQPEHALYINGNADDYRTPDPVGHLLFQGNTIESPAYSAIVLKGALRKIHIVGNRIWGANIAGVQLENVLAETSNVLIANNTTFECRHGFRLWDQALVRSRGVQISNNLFLASAGPDMTALNSGGSPNNLVGPGNGKAIRDAWNSGFNGRDGTAPAGNDFASRGWIPSVATDLRPKIEDITRDAKDLVNFLRPAKSSSLGTAGAGRVDPSLPSYVGALPPEGVPEWDWDRAWRMPAKVQLLTVSEKVEGGGAHRTINDALKIAKPWDTIRVLDDATYAERIVLDDARQHAGLTLEAVQGAVLSLTGAFTRSITVQAVSDVCVRGFHFREEGGLQGSIFVLIQGQCPGLVLEDLDLRGSTRLDGFRLIETTILPGERPIEIRRCVVQGFFDGIYADASSGVRIESNRISGAAFRGIKLHGKLAHIQVSGNAIWKCGNASLQLEDIMPGTDNILVANNTLLDSGYGFRIWDNPPYKEIEKTRVQVRSNIIVKCEAGDMGFTLGNDMNQFLRAGDSKLLYQHWVFRDNLRDRAGTYAKLETAAGDRVDRKGPPVGHNPEAANFLQPLDGTSVLRKDYPKDAPWLPPYIGAVAPKDTIPWNWDVTWRSRMRQHPKP